MVKQVRRNVVRITGLSICRAKIHFSIQIATHQKTSSSAIIKEFQRTFINI